MNKEPTLLEVNKYHQLHGEYHWAQRRYNALKSQGDYCPRETLNDALRDMVEAHAIYRQFKKELWPEIPGERNLWGMIKRFLRK